MKRRRVEKEIVGIDWDSEAEDKAALPVKKSNKKKRKVVDSSASDSDSDELYLKSKKNTKVVACSSSDSDDHARQQKSKTSAPDMRRVSQGHAKNTSSDSDGSATTQRTSALKPSKKKRKVVAEKSPLDQAVETLQSTQTAEALHATLEANLQRPMSKQPKTRKIRTAPKNHFMLAAARKGSAGSGLTPEQAGVFAFYMEYLKVAVHECTPQDPSVPPMFYPGRGDTDASAYLTKRFPALADADKHSGGRNVPFFGPIVSSPPPPPPPLLSFTPPLCCTCQNLKFKCVRGKSNCKCEI